MPRTNRLILAHIWAAVLAFGVAASMALMQAISRANLEVPYRSARMYYMSVTAHGVLMALVFTTFFIMALGYAVAQRENGDIKFPRLAWAFYLVAVAGVAMTAWAILTFRASVLYTFYPPLQAHPAFYIGLTLVVVASWGWCASMIASWREARRRQGEGAVSLAMRSTVANAMIWLLATVGVESEMLFQLIPWSLGWVRTVDPLLARTLFWYFGHPLVYFWLLPAYTIWYALVPREAGGKLFSEPLARVTFALFLVFSTPVGFHHQYQDPGIPAGWKLFHTFNTMAISFPSLMTAFTVVASLEVAGRLRGGQGLFGWIRTLPWGNPVVSSVLLAGLLFMVGGFGGSINAAYVLNSVVHNTAWVAAHFHLTVGSAAGLMGLPRRVFATDYAGAPQATMWQGLTSVSSLGGVVLFASAGFFVLVMLGTLLAGKKTAPQQIEWAEPLSPSADGFRATIWDRLGLWFVVAVVLVILAL